SGRNVTQPGDQRPRHQGRLGHFVIRQSSPAWAALKPGSRRHLRSLPRWLVVTLVAAIVLSGSVTLSRAEPETKLVLLLNSFSQRSKPWADYAEVIRTEIGRRGAVNFQEHSLH